MSKDNRSKLAARITQRHYNAIGSIPPLPLWRVIDEETAPMMKALKSLLADAESANAALCGFLGSCSAREIRHSFPDFKRAADRLEKSTAQARAILKVP